MTRGVPPVSKALMKSMLALSAVPSTVQQSRPSIVSLPVTETSVIWLMTGPSV